MQPSEPTYDIHEKIAQLETELLQHELLIRRQKHVINSLKTMITADHVQSPPRATANSSTSTGNRNTSSSSTSAPRVSAARNNTLNGGTKTPVAPSAGVAIAAAAPTKKTPIAAVVRPVNHQKKKTAMAKVIVNPNLAVPSLTDYGLCNQFFCCILCGNVGGSILQNDSEVWRRGPTEAETINRERRRGWGASGKQQTPACAGRRCGATSSASTASDCCTNTNSSNNFPQPARVVCLPPLAPHRAGF